MGPENLLFYHVPGCADVAGWGPHLENRWQREMLLAAHWGELWLPGASWGHYTCAKWPWGGPTHLTLLVRRASCLGCSQTSTRGLRNAPAAVLTMTADADTEVTWDRRCSKH